MNSKAPEARQVCVPQLHINLWRAVKRDYGSHVDPSTPVFLRGYALGFCAQAIPQLLGLLHAVILRTRKGFTKGHARRFARRLVKILRDATGRRSAALFFALSLGGANYLEPRLLAMLHWARSHIRNKEQDDMASSMSIATTKARKKTRMVATFIASALCTWLAFTLQKAPSPLQQQAPLSSILPVPLSSTLTNNVADPTFKHSVAQYASPTLDFTLFVTIRAVDTALRAAYTETRLAKNKSARLIASKGDVMLFVLSAWRIMFVWFYKPWLLPPAYNEWVE
jgi:hypothetical protein